MNQQTILVVEDDESTRNYLGRFLSSRGYAVNCAGSAEDMFSRLAGGNSPDVILLDLTLPGMHGKEALVQLKKRDCAIPVIIVSGEGQIRNVVEAIKMGASDYMVKPFEEEELE